MKNIVVYTRYGANKILYTTEYDKRIIPNKKLQASVMRISGER